MGPREWQSWLSLLAANCPVRKTDSAPALCAPGRSSLSQAQTSSAARRFGSIPKWLATRKWVLHTFTTSTVTSFEMPVLTRSGQKPPSIKQAYCWSYSCRFHEDRTPRGQLKSGGRVCLRRNKRQYKATFHRKDTTQHPSIEQAKDFSAKNWADVMLVVKLNLCCNSTPHAVCYIRFCLF